MQLRTRSCFATLVVALALMTSCESMPQTIEDPFGVLSDQVNELNSKGTLAAEGRGVDMASRTDIAREKAILAGTAALTKMMEQKVSVLDKQFQESLSGTTSVGEEINDAMSRTIKTVASQTMKGVRQMSKVMFVKTGSKIEAAVIMGVESRIFNSALLDQIKAQPKLYERFRATEAYKDLEAEVAQLNAAK